MSDEDMQEQLIALQERVIPIQMRLIETQDALLKIAQAKTVEEAHDLALSALLRKEGR
jgi:hypothetical protein